MSEMQKRALVTGGAGFLGSHLCRALIQRGFNVVAMDNFCTGSPHNIADLLPHLRFELIEHDITKPFDCAATHVFNFACAASPPHYQRDPIHTTLTCVQGTYHALTVAQRYNARFLQASTSEIYGDPEEHPQKESYRGYTSCIGPRACYDEGKRCAESLVMDFARVHGVTTRIARIFNTYGPGMALDDGRIISNFLVQALRNEPLTIYGDGTQTRSLCYVSDLIEGLLALIEHPTYREPVNLGNPHEMSVEQVAHAVLRAVGGRGVVYEPLPVDDPRRRCPDITLARRLLGFEPKVGFEVGVERTVGYFWTMLQSEHG
jgi:UDP-glucuronate decarboxylase